MSISTLNHLTETWKSETAKGNELLNASYYNKALPHYMEAMMAAELLLRNNKYVWKQGVAIPKWYYLSCTNIAKTYKALHDNNNAADYFLYGTFKIKQLADTAFSKNLKQTATIYCKKVMQEFINFSKEIGQPIPIDLTKNETFFQIEKMKALFDNAENNKN
jgi:hypothetical protein